MFMAEYVGWNTEPEKNIITITQQNLYLNIILIFTITLRESNFSELCPLRTIPELYPLRYYRINKNKQIIFTLYYFYVIQLT